MTEVICLAANYLFSEERAIRPIGQKEFAHIKEAGDYANRRSPDPSTKVGAKILSKSNQAFFGVNDFPHRYVADIPTWENRDLKNKIVVHAEINAILQCLESGHTPDILYTTKAPCERCAGVIINSGVTTVFFPERVTSSSWAASQELALRLFACSGLKVIELLCISMDASAAKGCGYTIL
jgi:dCMP deaminase